jgi:Dyp-type peroxidase family
VHHAVATPGDLLFHIRAARMDLCFELAARIIARLGAAVSVTDEVHGFKYFDDRDLLGFVDGTENPVAQAAVDATLIGAEDAAFAGGSYVIVQNTSMTSASGTPCRSRLKRQLSAGRNSRTSSWRRPPNPPSRTTS